MTRSNLESAKTIVRSPCALLLGCALAAVLMLAMPANADDTPAGSPLAQQGNPDSTSVASSATGDSASTQPARLADDPRMIRWRYTIFWTLVILVIFVSAAAVIVVFSRRYRQYLRQSTQHEKTEYVDVWKMHKVPEDLDIEPDEPDDNGDADRDER